MFYKVRKSTFSLLKKVELKDRWEELIAFWHDNQNSKTIIFLLEQVHVTGQK
jgi:hypothetical protein